MRDGKAIEKRSAVPQRLPTRLPPYRTRTSCYEKPSHRRRRKEAMRIRGARYYAFFGRRVRLTVYLTLAQLYSDGEPFKCRRHPTKKQIRRLPASPDELAL
jgi:hypothetical protein